MQDSIPYYDILLTYHHYFYFFCIAELITYSLFAFLVIVRLKRLLACRNYIQILVFIGIFTSQIVEEHILIYKGKNKIYINE